MMLLARFKVPRLGLAVAVAVLLVLLAVMRIRSWDGAVAVLDRTTGHVERDRRTAVGTWENAAPGAEFVYGDGLKTSQDSRAVVTFSDRSRLTLDPNTVVRFLEHPSNTKAPKLDVQTGSVTLEAADEPLDVDFALGVARIDSHAKLRVVRDGTAVRLEVVIGSARLLETKELIELTVGKAVEILPDRSVHAVPRSAPAGELPAPSTPVAPTATEVSSPAPAPAAEDGAKQPSPGLRQRGPEPVDFTASAGESLVIHDARPPTALGLTQNLCPGTALLSLSSARGDTRVTVGSHVVSAYVPAGTHHYTLSCLDEHGEPGPPAAKGMLTVLSDAGTRKLPKAAPASSFETDGRRYTVLYQTLLPRISVIWPNAPQAASYTLTVRSSSGSRSVKSSAPNYGFSAGALAEGEHSFVFEAAGKRSKPTDLVIRFDNATPTASITSPADGSFAPGASVVVAGAALTGFRVSVAGKELAQDDQNRFSGEVTAPSAERALVIRFSHPSRGTHYYLRRSAGH